MLLLSCLLLINHTLYSRQLLIQHIHIRLHVIGHLGDGLKIFPQSRQIESPRGGGEAILTDERRIEIECIFGRVERSSGGGNSGGNIITR